jgi:hypothetical protein
MSAQTDRSTASPTPTTAVTRPAFPFGGYGAVLQAFVDDSGMVDYRYLKANRRQLDAFALALAQLDRAAYERWSDAHKIAFWINVYNALTLKAIVDNYPIKSSFVASLRYPKNSIRQIRGVWDKLQFTVMGEKRTLDWIEHSVLRVKFNEPRIHMALVCAAMGCPPLRNEPYVAERLDRQLDDQARRFMSNSEKFRVDKKKNRVYLSAIFKWFGDDFVKTYGGERPADHGRAKQAAIAFAARYVGEPDRKYLMTARYDVKYLDYDWSLNEKKTGSK